MNSINISKNNDLPGNSSCVLHNSQFNHVPGDANTLQNQTGKSFKYQPTQMQRGLNDKFLSTLTTPNVQNVLKKQSSNLNTQTFSGQESAFHPYNNSPYETNQIIYDHESGFNKFTRNTNCQCRMRHVQQMLSTTQMSTNTIQNFQIPQPNTNSFLQKCQPNHQREQVLACPNFNDDFVNQVIQPNSSNNISFNGGQKMTPSFESNKSMLNKPAYHSTCQEEFNDSLPPMNNFGSNNEIVVSMTDGEQNLPLTEGNSFLHVHPDNTVPHQQFPHKQIVTNKVLSLSHDMNNDIKVSTNFNTNKTNGDTICTVVPIITAAIDEQSALVMKSNKDCDSSDNVVVRKQESKTNDKTGMSFFKKSSKDSFLPQTQLNININLSTPPCCSQNSGHMGLTSSKPSKNQLGSNPIKIITEEVKSDENNLKKWPKVDEVGSVTTAYSLQTQSSVRTLPTCEKCKSNNSNRPSSRSSEISKKLPPVDRRESRLNHRDRLSVEENSKKPKRCTCSKNLILTSEQTPSKGTKDNNTSEDDRWSQSGKNFMGQGDQNGRNNTNVYKNIYSYQNEQQRNSTMDETQKIKGNMQQNPTNMLQQQNDQRFVEKSCTPDNSAQENQKFNQNTPHNMMQYTDQSFTQNQYEPKQTHQCFIHSNMKHTQQVLQNSPHQKTTQMSQLNQLQGVCYSPAQSVQQFNQDYYTQSSQQTMMACMYDYNQNQNVQTNYLNQQMQEQSNITKGQNTTAKTMQYLRDHTPIENDLYYQQKTYSSTPFQNNSLNQQQTIGQDKLHLNEKKPSSGEQECPATMKLLYSSNSSNRETQENFKQNTHTKDCSRLATVHNSYKLPSSMSNSKSFQQSGSPHKQPTMAKVRSMQTPNKNNLTCKPPILKSPPKPTTNKQGRPQNVGRVTQKFRSTNGAGTTVKCTKNSSPGMVNADGCLLL